jgi:hypothetical protein
MLMSGVESGEFDGAEHFQFFQQDDTGVSLRIDTGVSLTTGRRHSKIPETWILLDNQSTVDVFQNANLLKNIREHTSCMNIHCNAGTTTTKLVGDLPGYGTVWFNPKGIANILSLSHVIEKGYSVLFSSCDNGGEFLVQKPDGSTQSFIRSDRGLYYMDTAPHATTLVNTVAENKSKYSP